MALDLPPAHEVAPSGDAAVPYDVVVLTHDERVLRRRVLVTAHGERVLVDLPATRRLEDRDRLVLTDGRRIEVIAAEEPLMAVTGDLPRLAWHIGNRHLPCRIEPERLLVPRDHVLRAMLEGLGATVEDVSEPFVPEGGAYDGVPGHGHGHGDEQGHGHDHGHSHGHDHARTGADGHGHGH